MKARIIITLKPGVLDPQGKAIEQTLEDLGFNGVTQVRQGKCIDVDLGETDTTQAHATLNAMCSTLLANPVIEEYAIELGDAAS
ncbi:MAG: phosphoribosylformylglycinamidine synthase subunit PurS [Parvularculales bacterium]